MYASFQHESEVMHMCLNVNLTAGLTYELYEDVVLFNGSYSDGDSECVPVYIAIADDDKVEGTEKIATTIHRGIISTVFIIDDDCKPYVGCQAFPHILFVVL